MTIKKLILLTLIFWISAAMAENTPLFQSSLESTSPISGQYEWWFEQNCFVYGCGEQDQFGSGQGLQGNLSLLEMQSINEYFRQDKSAKAIQGFGNNKVPEKVINGKGEDVSEKYKQAKKTREKRVLREVTGNVTKVVDFTPYIGESAHRQCGKKTETPRPLPSLDGNSEWNPGCEPLAQNPSESDVDVLFNQCIASLRNVILKDALVNGKLNRKKLFENMLDRDKINPREMRFLAMVFTSFGETRGMLSEFDNVLPRDDEANRYQHVMKVLDNRLNRVEELRPEFKGKLTVMNMALEKWQFSIWNPGDPNLSKILNYGEFDSRNASMKNAVSAFIKYQNSSFIPAGTSDNTYHYVSRDYYEKTKNDPQKWYCACRSNVRRVDFRLDGETNADRHHLFFAGRDGDMGFPFNFNPWAS